MDEQLAKLEKEYCPPLDSALFYAIAFDFDLLDPKSLKSAKDALDAIKANAEVEEALGFDPSGSSNVHDASSSTQEAPSQTRSCDGERAASSNDTDLTSLTASARSLTLDDIGPHAGMGFHESDSGIENIPREEKLAILSASFPDLKSFDIGHVLTRCNDNIERAIDELLSKVYFEAEHDTDGESQAVPKGVDGFAQNGAFKSKKRGKGKKKKQDASQRHSTSSLPSTPTTQTTTNKWTTTEDDIEFIVQRTTFSSKTVRSAYHKSSGSLRVTIQSLSEASLNEGLPPDDAEEAVIEVHAAELSLNYPLIQGRHIKGIVKMSYPNMAWAHELAKALMSSHTSGTGITTIEAPIVPQYARPSLDTSEEGDFITVKRAGRRVATIDHSNASLLAVKYGAARSAAFSQAAAAYRKSRSQPLMGGAAAYYADVGREAGAAADAYSYAAANTLVSRQSTANQIDLHGIDVRNGVRISTERVEAWWESGQAEWARQGKVMGDGGFRIVTGVGRHSVAGKAVLGPAVRKALVAEGWRVNEASGVLTVQGRARSK